MEITLMFLVFIFSLAYVVYRRTRRWAKLPPGPWPLPILGHAHLLAGDKFQVQMELRQKYGDIVSLQLGAYKTLLLCTTESVKEAFSNSLITGRPDMMLINAAAGGKRGLLASEGDHWTEQTRFAHRYLRTKGFGKSSLEFEIILHEELRKAFETLELNVGTPISLADNFKIVLLNIMWTCVVGEQLSHSDPTLQHLLSNVSKGFESESSAAASISIFLPRLCKWFPEQMGFASYERDVKAAMPLYEAKITEYKETFEEGRIRNFIDAYLTEVNNCTDPGSSFYGKNGEKLLSVLFHDLFVGGFETTSLTLKWMILHLAKNQDLQEKVHAEIYSLLGSNNMPRLTDRESLNYVEAVIAETLRWSSIIPLGIMKTTLEDIEFRGYRIPKGTGFCPFIRGIHHDPNTWGDPENFRPDRFINPEGKFVKHDCLIPFSYGKRPCFGERAARDELFLITASLIQKFHIQVDPEQPNPSTEMVFSQLTSPHPYKVVLQLRK